MTDEKEGIKISDLVNENSGGTAQATDSNAALKVDETDSTEKKDEKKVVVSGDFTSVIDYLTEHKNKILNATLETISFKNVPDNKYMFFVGNCDEDADVVQIANPSQLQLLHTDEPTAIVVFPSGILVENATHRSYIMKTNCIQFELNTDSLPVSRTTISKSPGSGGDPNAKEFIPSTTEIKFSDTERLKTELNKEAKSLYETVRDFQNLDEMKKEVLAFMRTKKDILYLIKLENIMIETA